MNKRPRKRPNLKRGQKAGWVAACRSCRGARATTAGGRRHVKKGSKTTKHCGMRCVSGVFAKQTIRRTLTHVVRICVRTGHEQHGITNATTVMPLRHVRCGAAVTSADVCRQQFSLPQVGSVDRGQRLPQVVARMVQVPQHAAQVH